MKRMLLILAVVGLIAMGGHSAQAQVGSATAYCPSLTFYLVVGSRDATTAGQVSMVQQFLSSRYYQPVTGYYGPITASNVAKFQASVGLPQVGVVGPLTRAAIASACGPTASTVSLSALNPSAGPVGTQVAVTGSGFTSLGNTVHFGAGVIPGLASDGTHLTFTVPNALSPACFYSNPRCLVASQLVTPGSYNVSISNSQGESNVLTFTVATTTVGSSIQVTSPAVLRPGDHLNIAWNITEAPASPATSSVVLDLYTGTGTRIGTIAVANSSTGSYLWTIPTAAAVCTMQYPNGLCGQTLSGDYYIQASLVSGSGLEANPAVYASDHSGSFTIRP